MEKKTTKQQMTGKVVSNKMDKTVVVKVDVRMRHPKYHKSYTKSVKYKAHDDSNSAEIGDRVIIESTRPLSKDKHFAIIKTLKNES
jgi:small subunit ribosomal protein S17